VLLTKNAKNRKKHNQTKVEKGAEKRSQKCITHAQRKMSPKWMAMKPLKSRAWIGSEPQNGIEHCWRAKGSCKPQMGETHGNTAAGFAQVWVQGPTKHLLEVSESQPQREGTAATLQQIVQPTNQPTTHLPTRPHTL